MDRSSRLKSNNEKANMNNSVDQMYPTDIHRTFYTTAVEFVFFSSTYGTFSGIDHMLGQKTSVKI